MAYIVMAYPTAQNGSENSYGLRTVTAYIVVAYPTAQNSSENSYGLYSCGLPDGPER